MFPQLEHSAAAIRLGVGANALEHAQTVVQRVGQDVNLGLVIGDQFAIQPDVIGSNRHPSPVFATLDT